MHGIMLHPVCQLWEPVVAGATLPNHGWWLGGSWTAYSGKGAQALKASGFLLQPLNTAFTHYTPVG